MKISILLFMISISIFADIDVMKSSKSLIIKYEGFSKKSYLCPAGKRTIGYGFVGLSKNNISRKEADIILDKKIRKIIKKLKDSNYKFDNRNQIVSILSFIYNIGWYGFNSSTLAKRLREKNYIGARQELLRWNKITRNGKKVISKGLVRRRNSEYQIFKCN